MPAMSDVKTPTKPAGYEQDLFAWANDQAVRLRDTRPKGIDWENLAEEIESVGRSQKAEIRNRLRVLLIHLLKWQHQPKRRSASWQSTIGEQRISIEGVIEDSPSLRRYPSEILATGMCGTVHKVTVTLEPPIRPDGRPVKEMLRELLAADGLL